MKIQKAIVLLAMLAFLASYDEGLKTELWPRMSLNTAQAGELQQQTSANIALPFERVFELNSGITMEFVLIPAGQFHMGSPSSEAKRSPDEGPVHQVTISKPFYMGKFEVTQAQYKALMGRLQKKCKFEGDNLPVENTDYYHVDIFLKMLSAKHGLKFRLPTEAEWEYACRAGTNTPFYTGETISAEQANYDCRHIYGNGAKGHYLGRTSSVGSYRPNAFGLYDMHGNVWEWCSDLYDKDYYKTSEMTDPKGPAIGKCRVIRGGSWNHNPNRLRCADRNRRRPGADRGLLGFRVVLEAY